MYTPTPKKTWIGREDQNEGDLGLRWHQKITLIDLKKDPLPALKKNEKGIVILGFKSDEGVRRNKGRVGAQEGPDWLRKACSNHADHFSEKTHIIDGGDVTCIDYHLESAQEELQGLISIIKKQGYFAFVFGGGHEVAFPHAMGLFDVLQGKTNLGIINIDAHFDLRKPEEIASSGTPFYQIAEYCKDSNLHFNYLCLGIQKSTNTRALFERANALGVKYIMAKEIKETLIDRHKDFIKNFIDKVDHIYLTICLDVFDIAYAPGVSAPSVNGLSPNLAFELINAISTSGKLISADIAELNPSLDQDTKTSKLAAKIAFEIITDYQA